jgi:cytochrome c
MATVARRLLFLAAAVLVAACDTEPRPLERRVEVAAGDLEMGRQQFRRYGCHACHYAPGVRAARGRVGPPLDGWSNRRFIAGTAPNTADMLVQFIQDPHSIRPGTAMPNLGVTELDARHIAAYLFSLD